MNPSSPVSFAIAGCGYVGKRHAETISRHPSCRLVALIDQQPEQAASLASMQVPVYDGLSSFYKNGGHADVVVVATPNGTHAALAKEAMQHGSHVLIEKPMALHKKDADAILEISRSTDRRVMVVLQNRYAAVSQWLKEIVEKDILGQLYFVEVNCFWNRDERYYKKGSWHGSADLDGGTLFTQFSHFIDTIYWLFGNITDIHSRFYNYRHQHLTAFEDTGTILFNFENGGNGCFNFSTASWEKNVESSITILAEHGSIKISGQYMNTIEHCHIKNYELPSSFAGYDASGNNTRMLEAMLDAVRSGGSTNACDGAMSVDIIERMYGGRP